jgi:hypothetical protein
MLALVSVFVVPGWKVKVRIVPVTEVLAGVKDEPSVVVPAAAILKRGTEVALREAPAPA